jgi:hypothetical protein
MKTTKESQVGTGETKRIRDLNMDFKQPPENLHKININKTILNASAPLDDSSKRNITCDYYYG